MPSVNPHRPSRCVDDRFFLHLDGCRVSGHQTTSPRGAVGTAVPIAGRRGPKVIPVGAFRPTAKTEALQRARDLLNRRQDTFLLPAQLEGALYVVRVSHFASWQSHPDGGHARVIPRRETPTEAARCPNTPCRNMSLVLHTNSYVKSRLGVESALAHGLRGSIGPRPPSPDRPQLRR